MEAPIFTFSEQKRCSSFPEVPALHLTTFLSHVLAQQPHQDSGSSFTLQCSGILMMSLPLGEPGSNPIVLAWTAGARRRVSGEMAVIPLTSPLRSLMGAVGRRQAA